MTMSLPFFAITFAQMAPKADGVSADPGRNPDGSVVQAVSHHRRFPVCVPARRECFSLRVHILLVEDHADTRFVLAKLLARWGHEVAEAGTAASAIALLKNSRFDVLLSDIGLPDGDGFSVVAAAVARGSARFKVAISAQAESEDLNRGLRAGFDYYMDKPFDAAKLKTLIQRA